ncbi:hypothetical protein CYMTET_28357, partial [Cymbomonas tetramitiformis]
RVIDVENVPNILDALPNKEFEYLIKQWNLGRFLDASNLNGNYTFAMASQLERLQCVFLMNAYECEVEGGWCSGLQSCWRGVRLVNDQMQLEQGINGFDLSGYKRFSQWINLQQLPAGELRVQFLSHEPAPVNARPIDPEPFTRMLESIKSEDPAFLTPQALEEAIKGDHNVVSRRPYSGDIHRASVPPLGEVSGWGKDGVVLVRAKEETIDVVRSCVVEYLDVNNKQAVMLRLLAIQSISQTHYITCVQLRKLLSAKIWGQTLDSEAQGAVLLHLYPRLVDRETALGPILSNFQSALQKQALSILGPINVISYQVTYMYFRLDLEVEEDCVAAKRIARTTMRSSGPDKPRRWENFTLNGKTMDLEEDFNMWHCIQDLHTEEKRNGATSVIIEFRLNLPFTAWKLASTVFMQASFVSFLYVRILVVANKCTIRRFIDSKAGIATL